MSAKDQATKLFIQFNAIVKDGELAKKCVRLHIKELPFTSVSDRAFFREVLAVLDFIQ